MSEVDKSSPGGLLARAEWLLNVGYDIAAVMGDQDWRVMLIDGYPEIALSADGVRKMALLAPAPEAGERAERIIENGRRA